MTTPQNPPVSPKRAFDRLISQIGGSRRPVLTSTFFKTPKTKLRRRVDLSQSALLPAARRGYFKY